MNLHRFVYAGIKELLPHRDEEEEEDEEEEDELADLPSDMKTKHGYLKDDFIVDDHTSSVEHSVNGSVTPSLSGTDDDYESELDFEEYEYMDSSGGEEISQSEEEEEQDS